MENEPRKVDKIQIGLLVSFLVLCITSIIFNFLCTNYVNNLVNSENISMAQAIEKLPNYLLIPNSCLIYIAGAVLIWIVVRFVVGYFKKKDSSNNN